MVKEKIKLKDKTTNQVNVIYPYRSKEGTWAFDDEEVGLQGEPFVGIVNQMIDMYAKGKKKITAYISSEPIKDYTLVLDKLKRSLRISNEGDYVLRHTDMVGWLCPATLKYFKDYPDNIYVKIEVK